MEHHIQRTRKWAAILATIVVARAALATVFEVRPFADFVRDATYVATIRLLDREQVSFEYEGREEICGYRYRGRILKAFKGSAEELVFFGPMRVDFTALDWDYLVLAYRTDPVEAKELAAPALAQLSDLERARFICRIDAAEVFVKDRPNTLIPFLKQFPEDPERLLRVKNPSALSAEDLARHTTDEEGVEAVSWRDVEHAIRLALEGDQER